MVLSENTEGGLKIFVIVDICVHSSHNDNSYGFVVYTTFQIGSAFYNASAIFNDIGLRVVWYT